MGLFQLVKYSDVGLYMHCCCICMVNVANVWAGVNHFLCLWGLTCQIVRWAGLEEKKRWK